MHFTSILLVELVFALLTCITTATISALPNYCACGWRLKDALHYMHRLYDDFSTYPTANDVLRSTGALKLRTEWLINGYRIQADNPSMKLDEQFDTMNVMLRDGELIMRQRGYTELDKQRRQPVSIAGIQTKAVDILHGSFRVTMKLEGAQGGAVSSFFWYNSDTSEIDIEAVTRGTSVVNNTINYTSHPSANAEGTPIPNATLSLPLDNKMGIFREHRFDCDPDSGAKYYLDGLLMHSDNHSIARAPGSVQLQLWADGNNYWSGRPSATDVFMRVKKIVLYYNTTMSGNDTCVGRICEEDESEEPVADAIDAIDGQPATSRGNRLAPLWTW